MSASPFQIVNHHICTTAILADFKSETANISWRYDDVEGAHRVEVRRQHRWSVDSENALAGLIVTAHPCATAEDAQAKFTHLVAAALRCAPAFIPGEW